MVIHVSFNKNIVSAEQIQKNLKMLEQRMINAKKDFEEKFTYLRNSSLQWRKRRYNVPRSDRVENLPFVLKNLKLISLPSPFLPSL